LTVIVERVATERPVISLDCLLYTHSVGEYYFVYKSVWLPPDDEYLVEIGEFVRSVGAELIIESEQVDYQMMHRRSVMSVYRVDHG